MKHIKLLTFTAIMILHNQIQSLNQNSVQENNVEQVVEQKQLPLHDIIKNQQYTTAQKLKMMKKILDQKQVDINAQDAAGKTALNLVTFYKGDPAIAKLLIEYGANVNEPDLFNETPLHNAITKEDIVTAAMLLKDGANVRFENDKGVTPLDLARSQETIKLLGLEQDTVAL